MRGINQFVSHAFSPAPFPDPDCPPHFYAHGNNPQFRCFGELMAYMNRVATLTSADCHVMPAAVLYHGEQEWADARAMPFEKPLRALYDVQNGCRRCSTGRNCGRGSGVSAVHRHTRPSARQRR